MYQKGSATCDWISLSGRCGAEAAGAMPGYAIPILTTLLMSITSFRNYTPSPRSTLPPCTLHNQAQRGKLAGAIAQDGPLLSYAPALPVKLVLRQAQQQGSRTGGARTRDAIGMQSPCHHQAVSCIIEVWGPTCVGLYLQQHRLPAGEGGPHAKVDLLAGIHLRKHQGGRHR